MKKENSYASYFPNTCYFVSKKVRMTDIQYVDDQDRPIGTGTKKEAREKGIRHRVSRVILINAKKELLISQRALHLRSNPGLWSVSAAGHVDAGESYETAAYREMKEEIGVENVVLKEIAYVYTEDANVDKPKQFAKIYQGLYDGDVTLNPKEVSDSRWISMSELQEWIQHKPQEFTPGSLHALQIILKST
jgi:isopentenyldiphosphate isomerase